MKEYLKKISLDMGIELKQEELERFDLYRKLLTEWNEKMNLTAITEEKEVAVKHFLDCISLLKFESISGAKVVDVGTGAGFPGIPLAIVSDIKLTLIDSLNKRISFLEEVKKQLCLNSVECIHLRAEEGGHNEEFRQKYDICVSRAVAELSVLCEYCLPYVKKGGKFLAFKGGKASEEIESAQNAVEILGGKIIRTYDYQLPNDINHNIVVIEKIKDTPSKYPRNAGKIKKSPLK